MEKSLEKLVLILPNVTCFLAGSIHGGLEASATIDAPHYYLWLTNIAGTSIGKTLLTKEKESYLDNTARGILLGTIAAPLEYALGYVLGYSTNFVIEKMFN